MQPNNGQNQNNNSSQQQQNQQQDNTQQTQDTRSADDKLLDDIFGTDNSTQNSTQQTQPNNNQQQPNTQQTNQQQPPPNQTQNQNKDDKGNQQQQQVLNNPEYDRQFQNQSAQLDTVAKMVREQQLNTLLNSTNGKFYKPYEDRLKRAAMDSKNVNLTMDQVVASALTPNEIMRIGAKIFQSAETNARVNSTGGDTGVGDTLQAKEIGKINFKDTAEMPSDKFKDMLSKAKQGFYIKK